MNTVYWLLKTDSASWSELVVSYESAMIGLLLPACAIHYVSLRGGVQLQRQPSAHRLAVPTISLMCFAFKRYSFCQQVGRFRCSFILFLGLV
jgi:hypothetical protein